MSKTVRKLMQAPPRVTDFITHSCTIKLNFASYWIIWSTCVVLISSRKKKLHSCRCACNSKAFVKHELQLCHILSDLMRVLELCARKQETYLLGDYWRYFRFHDYSTWVVWRQVMFFSVVFLPLKSLDTIVTQDMEFYHWFTSRRAIWIGKRHQSLYQHSGE